jgi:hypothetical protein
MTDLLLGRLTAAGDIAERARRAAVAASHAASQDAFISGSFKRGFDTFRIAAVLRIRESIVANRLASIRDGAHA